MDAHPPNWRWIGQRDARLGKTMRLTLFPDKESQCLYNEGYAVGESLDLDVAAINYKRE